ncbi:MAG TPA: hypothetical protein VNK82_06710 [Terriglobales bacterium]|nr:hypothetical protein [Terriglobales bacterium]
MSPQELVRKAVDNTLKDGDRDAPYIYRLRRERPGVNSETRDIVMTRDGLVARLVAFNDRPLTDEQRARDDARISRLLSDPREQARRRRQQEEERARVRRMLSALPEAFLYEPDGQEQGPSGTLIRLKFRPNPEFDPPTRETIAFKGAEGTILIDEDEHRIARFDATLVQDVNVGWGLLAHLNKGGRFIVEQTRLPDGNWETTSMTLDFTGRAFLFKSLKIQSRQTITDFRPAPAGLSLAEGVALLRKQNGIVAGK